jgi:phosphoglycolate phosphatase
VYADIPSLLRAVGHRRNFLATSKPRVFAEQVLAHFGLSGLLKGTYGSELSGERSDKGQLEAPLMVVTGLKSSGLASKSAPMRWSAL